MEKKALSGYTAPQGRRFALTVGAAFLVFAGVAWWRGHPALTGALGALGGILAVLAMAAPSRLGPIERGWMALAHAISKVTTPIVMGVMYLLVLYPVGVLRRVIGGNPLEHRVHDASYWQHRAPSGRRSSMQRQF